MSVSQLARCARVLSPHWHGGKTAGPDAGIQLTNFLYADLDRVKQPGYRVLHMGDRRQGQQLFVHLSYAQRLQKSTKMQLEGGNSYCEAGMALARNDTVAHAHSLKSMLPHVDDPFERF